MIEDNPGSAVDVEVVILPLWWSHVLGVVKVYLMLLTSIEELKHFNPMIGISWEGPKV